MKRKLYQNPKVFHVHHLAHRCWYPRIELVIFHKAS